MCFLLFFYYQYKSWDEKRLLGLLPYGLNISKILYSNEESWGMGPGGNETGIIAYELPSEVATEIQKIGVSKFSKGTGGFGDFDSWKQTPILLTDEWLDSRVSGESEQNIQTPKIGNFLERLGYSVFIDPKIESEINNAITKPGSYYAYRKSGVIVIILPNNRKVIYAYAG